MNGKYKLTEANLNIGFDLKFIDNVLESVHAQAEPDVRRHLLDLSYTFARNQIVEARRFANLNNKKNIDIKDIRMARLEKTDDFQYGPLQLTKPIIQPLTAPAAATSLLLPPWRNCQVGANAELKQLLPEPDKGEPPNKMARLRVISQPKIP